MDIRDKIREKFNSRRSETLKEATNSKWDSDTQPNIYALDAFLRKSGYRLIDILEDTHELIIEAIKSDYLHPEISHDTSEDLFYAKVVEHGMLVASDIEEIIKGYNTALGVLKYLGSIDLSKLEVSD